MILTFETTVELSLYNPIQEIPGYKWSYTPDNTQATIKWELIFNQGKEGIHSSWARLVNLDLSIELEFFLDELDEREKQAIKKWADDTWQDNHFLKASKTIKNFLKTKPDHPDPEWEVKYTDGGGFGISEVAVDLQTGKVDIL